ncbi:anchored repeat-type ABC transporter permease subunit [Corynebacterium renale]|uniref:Anchored repeat-type ABC transporter permease subunit n=1 Tax=Corynebacterium renale TaxID=1724 RepID=A0A2A9DKM3_9CORY|nr:anchored repeat-type ABC transporter permease subunit [Corynebacterium renale]PFG27258.1 anchored repeat-type ABC transporter permease subunit [Corynebacterium renale]SQI23656.1 ABC transporter permease protein [Corynebacterium renale]
MLEISPLEFIQDLTNPALGFLPKALCIAVVTAIVCAVVGVHVVLRGMAFIGDAVSHAIFPGIAVAFALQGSVLLGGAVAGAIVAVLIAVTSQRRQVREDSAIGIFFAAAFALGLVIMSRIQGYTTSLTSILFGSITGISATDIVVSTVVGAAVIAVITVCTSRLVAVALDRETAQVMNIRVFAMDLIIYLAVTAAVVISVRAVGTILVLALLITPAATARLLTTRLSTMMAVSVTVGVIGAVVGLYLSWSIDLPTGATIVLTLTALFIVVWILTTIAGQRTYPVPHVKEKECAH